MNKIDLFFAKHMWLTYGLGFVIVPVVFSQLMAYMFAFSEAWQYAVIFGFIYGIFFLGPKVKKYKEFNNQKINEEINND